MTGEERDRRIEELKEEIRDMRKRMPHHSAKPQMDFELMELEDELAVLRAQS